MKKTLSAFLFLIFALAPHVAVAQQTALAIVVQSCGTAPYTYVKGQRQPVVQDVNGNVCTTAAVTATVSGFAPSLAYATCTATDSACASTAIPTNTGSVILFNAGTTTVSCTLASGAATGTTGKLQIPASSGLPLATVYGATTYDHFACIDQSGSASNVVIASGGSGLPTGWGGGGGSGLAVTDPSTYTYSTSQFTPGGGFYQTTATTNPLTNGQQGMWQMTAQRAGFVNSRDSTGAENIGTTADSAYTGSGNATAISALKGLYINSLLGTATNGTTYPGSSIGIGGQDGSGLIQPLAMSNWGTAPTGKSVQGVNAYNSNLAPLAPVVSASAESNHVLKSSAGNLVSLTTTIGVTTGWLMLFDATSAPSDGSVTPKYCRYIKSDGSGGASSLAWQVPLSFATGITAVFSSTGCFTKTASATATFSGQVQ